MSDHEQSVRMITLDGRKVLVGNPAAAGVAHYAEGEHPPAPTFTTEEIARASAASLGGVERAEAEALLPPPKDGPGWQDGRIATMDAFHRACRDYRESLEAAREVDAQHEAEIAPLLAKLKAAGERADAARKPLEAHAEFLHGRLLGFAQTHRRDLLKGQRFDAKSALLQSGVRVAWRHDPGGYRWDDSMKPSEREAELMGWAVGEETRSGETLTRAVWYANLENIKKHLACLDAGGARDEGEPRAPPGLKYVEPGDILTITTDADKED